MLNDCLSSITYYLLLVFTAFEHLVIPLICLVVIIVLFKKRILNKKAVKIAAFLLVLLTFNSYFVGIYSNSKITYESFSVPERENYFYINSKDSTFSYQGRIFLYKKDEFPNNYIEVFSDEDLFNLDISNMGEFIINNNIGSKYETTDECKIIYSPLVLCEHNFLIGRNNYAGYIIIEYEDMLAYIPYELYFKETLRNDLTYSEIYSKKYQISISDIFNNIVTEKQYINYLYS